MQRFICSLDESVDLGEGRGDGPGPLIYM